MATTPSLEDLIAASVFPDIEETIPFVEISNENDHVTSSAVCLYSSTVFPPVESSIFGGWSRTKAENSQHEHDEKLRLQWEAEKAAKPKTPPKVVRANNPDALLKKAKEYMATPKEAKHNNFMRTPGRRPYNYGSSSGSRGLPRPPHTNNLFDRYRDRENWEKPILFGGGTTLGDQVIRYKPTDPAKDQGFRTIMIPVSASTTLEKLIENKLVGKGQIFSAQMLDVRAIKGMDSKKMARIIFVNEPKWINDEGEMRGVSWCADAPAYKVTTKTSPITEKRITDIGRGFTRVLSLDGIENVSGFSMPAVLDKDNIQPSTSPCHYKRDVHIISSASDKCNRITIEFNSIESASGFLYWIQKELRALGKTPLKFRFEKDNTMTADMLAAYIELRSKDDVSGNASDGPRAPSARHSIRPLRKNSQGMYPDGPGEDERRGHYKREPTKADSHPTAEDISDWEAFRKDAEKKRDEKFPGFVYSHEQRGLAEASRPLKALKMGLYKSRTGLNWDDEDDDDNFGLADLHSNPIRVSAQTSEVMAANAQPVATHKAGNHQPAPVASVFPHTIKAAANKVARPPSPYVGDDLTADRAFISSICAVLNPSNPSTMPAITDPITVLTAHLTGGDPKVASIASTPVMPTFLSSSGMPSNYEPASVEEEIAQEVPRAMVSSTSSNMQHPSTVSPGDSEILSVPPNIPAGR